MTRRMIDSDIWRSKKYARLPYQARLLLIGIITSADDQGRIDADPFVLKGSIFTFDVDVTPDSIQSWLTLLHSNETIILYKDRDNEQFAQLTNWWEYQSLQYAQPSKIQAPDGWTDRIRYTFSKGVILTCNWILADGTTSKNTCDEQGKPLTKTVISPESGGGELSKPEANQVNEQVNEQVNVQLELEEELELELEKEKEGGTTHAHTHEDMRNISPPFSVLEEKPEFREALSGEYMPGLPDPRRNRRGEVVTEFVLEAKRFGIEPVQFREMVDAFLTGCASKPLADAGGQRGEQVLLYAQEQVITLIRMDAIFRNKAGIESIFASWKENDWRGDSVPNSKQVLDHASKMSLKQVKNERKKPGASQQASPAIIDARDRADMPAYMRKALGV